MVQRLKLCAPKAGGLGSVLGQGRSHILQRKIPLAATKTQCTQIKINITEKKEGFPGGPMVKNLPCNARDANLITGLGRSHTLQSKYMCHNY